MRYGGKVYQGKHTAMVTQKEFDQVQELIKRKNAPRPEVTNEPDTFPYRGLIKCGECGCLITYTRKVRHYKNGTDQAFEYCYCTRRRKDYLCTQRITITPQELTKKIRAELEKYAIIDDFFQWACKYLERFDADAVATQQKDIRYADKSHRIHRKRA